MHEPRVLISILNWNNYADTIACIGSLACLDYSNYGVVVVDNHSGNDSVSRISAAFPQIAVIALDANCGYAGAHKVAADQALRQGADCLWILNNDVQVRENSLAALVSACNRYGPGVYGSITLKSAGTSTIGFGGGFEFPAHGEAQSLVYNRYQAMELDEYQARAGERKVWDVNGCSMLISLSVIKAHGFIDESFFLYGEETDYCLKLNRKGVPVVIVPASVVVHGVGKSFTNSRLGLVRMYYTTRNNFLLFRRHPWLFGRKIQKMYSRKSIKHLAFFFFQYWFRMGLAERISNAASYYENLGKLHALLGIRGKYLKPEKYLTHNPAASEDHRR